MLRWIDSGFALLNGTMAIVGCVNHWNAWVIAAAAFVAGGDAVMAAVYEEEWDVRW